MRDKKQDAGCVAPPGLSFATLENLTPAAHAAGNCLSPLPGLRTSVYDK